MASGTTQKNGPRLTVKLAILLYTRTHDVKSRQLMYVWSFAHQNHCSTQFPPSLHDSGRSSGIVMLKSPVLFSSESLPLNYVSC